ncbi:MAG TPA: hypothetical protein VFX51_24010 [Solirubrobacteraceae bacterium]|nr:hypothetical protein [Solirubrobacteraceae bacterium]
MTAALAALPAAASAKGWVCEASALRANVLDLQTLEPAVANRGGGDCKAAGGGGAFAPALPLGLQAEALTATTALAGPIAGPVQEQAGTSQATVARAGVASLPELPIPLPDPDFSDVDAIKVPGIGTVDLRPALEALIQPRALPDLDLLSVQAAHAEASAQCVSGVPRFRGKSTLASVSVNGVELGLDKATNEVVKLIDSQSIDPSDIDVSKVIAPPGTDLSALNLLIKPILNALPDITVPATLARIRLIPNERIQSGTRLTQRALHATINIAGRRFADVVVGEATAGVNGVSCGGVADLALQCTLRRLVLIDVYEQGNRVKLLGAADRHYVGKRVRIRFTGTGKTVARPKVRRDGTFRATAPLPDAKIRPTNRARYEATIRNQRSMKLKLQRRMIVSEMSARRGVVTIAGRVVGPFTSPMQKVLVKRRVTCRDWKVVKRFRPNSDGTFRIRLKAPKDGEAAVYRMTTRVKLYDWFAKTYPTFTLPRYVDLG